MKTIMGTIAASIMALMASVALAQADARLLSAGPPAAGSWIRAVAPPDLRQSPNTVQLREARYQIAQMERVLEGAAEHGATIIRERLQALAPSDMLLTENARARGFRLDGYGVFFDVGVPSLAGSVLAWSFRALDQNNLGIESALRTVRSFIEAASGGDANLQQALKRIELQVAPPVLVTDQLAPAQARPAGVTPTTAASRSAASDPVITDPDEAYRTEVRDALVGAMLEHSRGLNIAAGEWLTVAARRNDDRPRLAPADTEARTMVIRIAGSDLSAFLAGQISREEARKRIDVRLF